MPRALTFTCANDRPLHGVSHSFSSSSRGSPALHTSLQLELHCNVRCNLASTALHLLPHGVLPRNHCFAPIHGASPRAHSRSPSPSPTTALQFLSALVLLPFLLLHSHRQLLNLVPLSKATYQAPSISQPSASPVLQPSSSDPPNLQLWAGRIALTKTHGCRLELSLCPWYLRPCRDRSRATFSESPSHSLHDILNPLTALHPTTRQGWASNHTPASPADGNQPTSHPELSPCLSDYK